MDPENDTGTLVIHLSQTIEESKRLRDDLKHGRLEGHAPPQQENAPSAEDAAAVPAAASGQA